MSVSPEIIEKIQKECSETLSGLVVNTIAACERKVVDSVGDSLYTHSDALIDRFVKQMDYCFDELMDREIVKQDAVFSFETLSLVQEEELDVMVALEGMVNAARNEHLPVFISFNTRLSSLFPRKRIDESTNPLDPEQVATAFQEALRPLQLDAKNSLDVYRAFNKEVLKKLDEVLNQGNRILIDSAVIPSLGMEGAQKQEKAKAARSQPRTETSSFGTIDEEEYDPDETDSTELFSVMQNLLHFDEPAGDGGDTSAEPEVQDVDISDFDLDAALQAGGSVTRAADEGQGEYGRFNKDQNGGNAGPGSALDGVTLSDDDTPLGGTGMRPADSGGGYPQGGGGYPQGGGGYPQGGEGFPQSGGYPQGGGGYPQGGGGYPQGGFGPGGGGPMVPAQEVMIPASMIPGLLATTGVALGSSSPAPAASAMQSVQLQEGQSVQMVDQVKLMEILTDIQSRLNSTPALAQGAIPSTMEEVDRIDISASLGEMLQSSNEDENVISAVDRQSSDIINLVTLLYEAIWQDVSVPIPIKELIGRTQVTIIKVALNDTDFFNDENHPARMILNEFASSGIGWTEVEALEEDPLYQKISELVDRILSYTDDISLFEELIEDFKNFKAQESAKTKQLEQNILRAKERNERMDDIYELVSQKVEERILGRELDPFIDDLLHVHFHKFMVMLVIKEGPGSNAWKQAINTIDVLLWTVELKEHREDRQRLETVNPRLFNNLRKAFRIAGQPAAEVTDMLAKLEEIQEQSFPEELREAPEEAAEEEAAQATDDSAEAADVEATEDATEAADDNPKETVGEVRFLAAGDDEEDASTSEETASEDTDEADEATPVFAAADDEPETVEAEPEEELTEDSPYMKQVDDLSVGMWVEFAGDTEDNNTRCKLAAKINAIDKFIFVNRQGVKVMEKTKLGLAKELRDGTVSIISDGLLFSRALESVIGNLRDNQIEQQTASAYQPEKDEEPESESDTPVLDLEADSNATPEPAFNLNDDVVEAEEAAEDKTPALDIDIMEAAAVDESDEPQLSIEIEIESDDDATSTSDSEDDKKD